MGDFLEEGGGDGAELAEAGAERAVDRGTGIVEQAEKGRLFRGTEEIVFHNAKRKTFPRRRNRETGAAAEISRRGGQAGGAGRSP